MIKRVIWIILDSVGAGELPDALEYGDVGTDTIDHVLEANEDVKLSNLRSLGMGNIEGITSIGPVENPEGCFGRCAEISAGKDTTTGHWEMAGIYTKTKFPTYPEGFPQEIIDEFIREAGIPGILGNYTASGTEIIRQLGKEHMATKKPIVYTSADSVFQIACHEDIYSPESIYEICRVARKILSGNNAVARVIARPFIGEEGAFERTSNRRDFSIEPPEDNLLVNLNKKGTDVIAIGKIEDIFVGRGISLAIHTKNNMHGIDVTLNMMKKHKECLIFTNLVEFDSKWGHRNDVKGYAQGLKDFDLRITEIIDNMTDEDLLIINSDHGCDPTTKGTDHTREYIPLIVYGKDIKKGVNLKTMSTFADIGATIADIFGTKIPIGKSFLWKICK
ncbi:MAG: phosphopentomutase [Eubacterium sp.]